MYCLVIKCFIWSASELLLANAKKIRDGDSLTNKDIKVARKCLCTNLAYTHIEVVREKSCEWFLFERQPFEFEFHGMEISHELNIRTAGYSVGFIEVRINSILRCLQSSYSKLSSNTWATSKSAENKKQNSTAVIFVEITWKVIGTAKSFDTP